MPATSSASRSVTVRARTLTTRASRSVARSPPRSSSFTAIVWTGSSAPPTRRVDLRPPRTSAPSLPSVAVSSVTMTSLSLYATVRTTRASDSIVLGTYAGTAELT